MRVKLVVLLLVVLSCLRAFSQSPPANQGMRGETIRVEPARQVREDVDLWPLIARPKSDAELRVNATLTRLNKEFVKSLRDCDGDIIEFEKQAGQSGDPTKDDWGRSIKVTMRGPRFLSMVASDDFYCGGAHPDEDLTVLVFDMKTGAQVDWSTLVRKSAGASSAKNVLGDAEGATHPILLPELQAIYAAAEEDYCKDYFEDDRPFFLWPNAESGTLIAEVAGLPHIAAPCKNELKLTIEQARNLGFDELLLQAIEEAHRIAAAHLKAKPVQTQSAPAAPTGPD
jgi:hypothetical protein